MVSKNYNFICITDCNSQQFHIDATSMSDPRLRVSALRSQYRKYKKGSYPIRPVFKIFDGCNSFFVIDKREFESQEAALKHAQFLTEQYAQKIKGSEVWDPFGEKTEISPILTTYKVNEGCVINFD